MHRYITAALAALLVLLVACEKAPAEDSGNNGQQQEQESSEGAPIKVVDGKVRFYLSVDEKSPHAAITKSRISTASRVVVNGKLCTAQKEADTGKYYIDAPEAVSGEYNAVLTTSSSSAFYTSSPSSNVRLPHSQFIGHKTFSHFPMYTSYSKETGNKLVFGDGYAMLDIAVSGTAGSATIASVYVEAPSGTAISGYADYKPSKKSLSIKDGLNFAVLNCNSDPVMIDVNPAHLYIAIAPCKTALEVRLNTTDHRCITVSLPEAEYIAGSITSKNITFKFDESILYCEHFDTFVWGGNYVAGESSLGFGPSQAEFDVTATADLKGSEEAAFSKKNSVAGAPFFQSNTWDQVNGKNLQTSHLQSEEYIKSRGLWDYKYLFRCQEYQGCVAIGAGNKSRGILQTGCFKAIPEICSMTLSLDICAKAGFDDNADIQVLNGGYVTSAKLDGQPIDKSCIKFTSNASHVLLSNQILKPASSDGAAKTWHHLELSVDRATSGTCLYITTELTTNGNHGLFVDNIVATKTADMKRGSLRVLYWNIQDGMWADQANNYNNFVAWVKRYDPDICVWCEASTIYKDNSTTSQAQAQRFLPNGWPALAARYGHNYSALGGFRDNFPQEVTSKYPITTVLKITDSDQSGKPISHGAAIQNVLVEGKNLYIITLHTWPQAYGYGVSAAQQEASKAKNEGDLYREFEMKYILEHTYNAAAYKSQDLWLMMGDFNSRSRVDNWYYGYEQNSTKLLCQDQILNNTDLVDIIGTRYAGEFVSSTYGASRIDYMYANKAMYGKVRNAMILIDEWTTNYPDNLYNSGFYIPSDHRPILVDFDF